LSLFSGGSLRIELRAESRFIGCLSTIIVFMFTSSPSTTSNPTSSTAGLPDRLSSGDTVRDSKSPRSCHQTGSSSTTAGSGGGHVGHVIRRVKVYFEDLQLAELRPSAPFRRPPRVSGRHATVKIEGLPLDKSVYCLLSRVEPPEHVPKNLWVSLGKLTK